MAQHFHTPVMLKETIDYLDLKPGKVIVDATVGTGGHSLAIIEKILPGGKLICIDRDEESLGIARQRLSLYSDTCEFLYGNFAQIEELLAAAGVSRIDAILFDLGVSSYQLQNPQRGFSFLNEGPLDMRMDRNSFISAYDLINNLTEKEISTMLKTFGQERWHNRIAHLLIEEREKHPIVTTSQLSQTVERAIPARYRHYKIHPATRTFQAVRIAVNRELEVLESGISKAIRLLKSTGRICVISFHSLEDRIIKMNFRRHASQGEVSLLTKKPLTPSQEEIDHNRLSRSAKFRAAEKR